MKINLLLTALFAVPGAVAPAVVPRTVPPVAPQFAPHTQQSQTALLKRLRQSHSPRYARSLDQQTGGA
jgi:hypothetical protein